MVELENIKEVRLPKREREELFTGHCLRKYNNEFFKGEARERKAYGMILGVVEGDSVIVKKIRPLLKTVRHSEEFESHMDNLMKEHAIPSKTPMKRRGWVSDPEEMFEIYNMCDNEGLILIGAYHMRLVPWDGDPLRDTPTLIDTVLAKNSNIFQFIISFVDPKKAFMRAFFEGVLEKEVPIILI